MTLRGEEEKKRIFQKNFCAILEAQTPSTLKYHKLLSGGEK